MSGFKELLEITKDLTVLYVEDERPVKLEERLRRLFKAVIVASDGKEGWDKLNDENNAIDIVLTDYLMPIMNGLELIKKIREQDREIPIILITGYIESEFLIEAINLGVTQFVTKPIMVKNLMKAIEIAVQQGVLEKLAQTMQTQELELLRYREKYHSTQQEMAFMKELQIIKNDLLNRKIDVVNKNGNINQWFMDICYVPLDILSGDSYSIRETEAGKILLFITDAMGKGLSASVTSILTTSFINHTVDEMIEKNNFSLKGLLNAYTSFIRKELLGEEIICASFIYLNFIEEFMEYASFSMPPILAYTVNNNLIRIKSNNIPIIRHHNNPVIDRIDISNVRKMLIMSDGVNEGSVESTNTIYNDYVEEDFISSGFKDELYNKLIEKVKTPDDDVTFIFLNKINHDEKSSTEFTLGTRLLEVNNLTLMVEEHLAARGVGEIAAIPFLNSLTEIAMNAYEHGNLGIDSAKKIELTESGNYEKYLIETEKGIDKKIITRLSVNEENNKVMIMATVKDEGSGFDISILNEKVYNNRRFSGRGLKIAKTLSDILLYNACGNEALLIKNLNKEG
ncbi:MAG: response regulator [Candidatus Magnetoovum sp. WYHC-5]|nr:response regulator [Candidatus Magnetoovum sp. WYHC-5]